MVATGSTGICSEVEPPDTTVTVASGSPRAFNSWLMLSADRFSGLAPATATSTLMPARRRAGSILRISTLLGSTPPAAAIPSIKFFCAESSKSSTEIGSPNDRTTGSSAAGGETAPGVGDGGGGGGGGGGGVEVADVGDGGGGDVIGAVGVVIADGGGVVSTISIHWPSTDSYPAMQRQSLDDVLPSCDPLLG